MTDYFTHITTSSPPIHITRSLAIKLTGASGGKLVLYLAASVIVLSIGVWSLRQYIERHPLPIQLPRKVAAVVSDYFSHNVRHPCA